MELMDLDWILVSVLQVAWKFCSSLLPFHADSSQFTRTWCRLFGRTSIPYVDGLSSSPIKVEGLCSNTSNSSFCQVYAIDIGNSDGPRKIGFMHFDKFESFSASRGAPPQTAVNLDLFFCMNSCFGQIPNSKTFTMEILARLGFSKQVMWIHSFRNLNNAQTLVCVPHPHRYTCSSMPLFSDTCLGIANVNTQGEVHKPSHLQPLQSSL